MKLRSYGLRVLGPGSPSRLVEGEANPILATHNCPEWYHGEPIKKLSV